MRQPFDPDAILAAIARGERSCGDFQMRIALDGTWYYQGTPIGRLPLVKLFASVLIPSVQVANSFVISLIC